MHARKHPKQVIGFQINATQMKVVTMGGSGFLQDAK
jgi:hypothetical protein